MRIFLVWPNPDPKAKHLILALRNAGHNVVYWVGVKNGDEREFSDIIFHDHFDALVVRSAPGVDDSKFPPPSKDLIHKLYGLESVILTMMHKKYAGLILYERKRLYYRLIRYWQGVIQKYRPEVIIFPYPPHTVYDFVVYSLAKLLEIKTVMFNFTRIDDRLLVIDDFTVGSELLAAEVKKNYYQKFLLSDLSLDIRNYYERQRAAKLYVAPPDLKQSFEKYSGLNLLALKTKVIMRSLHDLTVFKKGWQYFFKQFKSNLRKEYLDVQTSVDLSQKFIYVPLNYQPESTTSPLGDVFVDQIFMIEMLSYCLPAGWRLYVKEHPYQWLPRGLIFFDYRYKGYYREISKIKNVYLIPPETDNAALIEGSQAIATVTGTPGWEALLRLKPVLIFGYPWYKDCPGVFNVKDADSCQEALLNIQSGFKSSQQSLINYLVSFDKSSIRGYLDLYCKKISKLDEKTNKANILNALLLAIER